MPMSPQTKKNEPKNQAFTVVIVGNFNTTIFQPSWFAANGIIAPSDAEDAQIELIHDQLTSFKLEWLSLRVESERFIAETNQPPYVKLQDFSMVTRQCRTSHQRHKLFAGDGHALFRRRRYVSWPWILLPIHLRAENIPGLHINANYSALPSLGSPESPGLSPHRDAFL